MKLIEAKDQAEFFDGVKNFSNNRVGDIAEHYAITLFWDYGWEVFKNCGCDGPVDLVVIDDTGTVRLIDINTRPNPWKRGMGDIGVHGRTKLQKKLGIQIVEFDPEKRKLRFVEHKE